MTTTDDALLLANWIQVNLETPKVTWTDEQVRTLARAVVALTEERDQRGVEVERIRAECRWHEKASAEAFEHLHRKQRDIVTALGGDPDSPIGPLTLAEQVQQRAADVAGELEKISEWTSYTVTNPTKVLRAFAARLRGERGA